MNTLLDYVLFIGLTKAFAVPLHLVWIPKAISGAVAIVNSFVLNRQWVFRGRGRLLGEAGAFLGVTLIGVYAIQTPLTQLFSSVVDEPGRAAYDVAERLRVTGIAPGVTTEALAIKTTAFAIATVASTIWNFTAYRHWVFRPSAAPTVQSEP